VKTALDIIESFVAKAQASNLRLLHFRPPLPAEYPLVTFYQVGVETDSVDDSMRETAFTFVFDIWSDSARECYTTEATLDSAFRSLPFHVQKLGAVDNDSGEPGLWRRTLTYRFHWNF
jgi:hypothetical protein